MELDLHLDGENINKRHSSVVYARNKMVDVADSSAIIDEYGFELNEYTSGSIIGVIATSKEFVLFSLDGDYLEIGRVRNDTYTIILKTQYTNHTSWEAIRGTFDYNINGDLIVMFCNGVSNQSTYIYILNLDNLPFKSGLNINKELVNPSEISIMQLNPDASIPDIDLTGVNSYGGDLPTGAYYIFISYEIDSDDALNWMGGYKPIIVYDYVDGETYDQIEGSDGGINTSRSISLALSNIDEKFKYFKVGIIIKSKGILTAYYKKETVTGTTKKVTIDYLTEFTSIAVSELLVNSINYIKAKAVTKHKKALVLGGVVEDNIDDIQKYANGIKVEWVAEDRVYSYRNDINTFEESYKNETVIFDKRGFMPNEVYALYIEVEFNDGTPTKSYHIPGRAPITITLPSTRTYNENATIDSVTPDNQPTHINCNIQDTFLKSDEAIADTVRYFQTRDTAYVSGIGEQFMGYWENQNELYEDEDAFDIWAVDASGNGYATGNTLRGEKVRHHRFPSLRNLQSIYGDTFYEPHYSRSKVLGLKLTNIEFPDDIKDRVQGYKIKYAKRTFANSLIQAQSAMHQAVNYITGSNQIAGISRDGKGSSSFINNEYGLFPFDLLKYRATPLYSYVAQQLELEISPHSYGAGPIGSTQMFTGEMYLNGVGTLPTMNTVGDSRYIRAVDSKRYIYAGDNDNSFNINNTAGQTTIFTKLKAVTGVPTLSEVTGSSSTHAVFLSDLVMFKEDCYESYKDQELVDTGIVTDIGTTFILKLYGGDSYFGLHNYRITNLYGGTYYRVLHSILGFHANNIELRYEGTYNDGTNDRERLFPKLGGDMQDFSGAGYTSAKEKWIDLPSDIDNYYGQSTAGYNSDYTSVADLKVSIIYDVLLTYTHRFLNRVHISLPNQDESLSIGWRTFTTANYKEVDRSFGNITLLKGDDSKLYIQCENNLFIAAIKDTFTATDGELALKAGNIFDRDPNSVLVDEDGEIGCQNIFGAILTKFGYIVCDQQAKSIFILRTNIKEPSSTKVKRYLIDNLEIDRSWASNPDNPFNSSGIILGIDQENGRLLLSKKELPLPEISEEVEIPEPTGFTLSYNLLKEEWMSFHSYLPDYMFTMKNKLYSVKSDIIPNGVIIPGIFKKGCVYEHNDDSHQLVYYRKIVKVGISDYDIVRAVHDSIIDVVFHSFIIEGNLVGNHLEKILNSINWSTSVYDMNGTRLWDETIQKVVVYNDSQCTGEIDVNENDSWFDKSTGDIEGSTWYFSVIRDAVLDNKSKFLDSNYDLINTNISKTLKSWFETSEFISKFMVVRLITNKSDRLCKLNNVYVEFEQIK
jgi:nuclear transport factor 2 (NTF2) superfamily protein